MDLEESKYVMDVDYVVAAVGSKPEEWINKLNLKLNQFGNIEIDENNKTSNNKIFAGGDVSGTKQTVAWAVRSGRDAAENIIEYLTNRK